MEDLFEAYTDHAAKTIADGANIAVDRAELIRGLETFDLEGRGGDFVANRVLHETDLIFNALLAGRITRDTAVVLPKFVAPNGQYGRMTGWDVAPLDHAPDHFIRSEEFSPRVLLASSGTLYAYQAIDSFSKSGSRKPLENLRGRAFNRYAPVCRTRVNDRSILHGLAMLVTEHQLDVHPQPAIT
jgi:hypothetical protein